MQSLDQLEKSVGKHLKIRHNKAIATFYKNGGKNVTALQSVLTGEDFKSDSTHQQTITIAQYNLALIYFHQKTYQKAIAILNNLSDSFEKIYENTSAKIGVLLLHCFFQTNQIKRAELFLNYLISFLNINLDLGKDDDADLSLISTSSNNERLLTTTCDEDIKNELQIFKIHLLILNKSQFIFPEDRDHSKYLQENEVLKSYNNFMKNNIKYAENLLSKQIPNSDKYYDIINLNNKGILNVSIKNYGIAERLFQSAIMIDKKLHLAIKSHSHPLHVLSYLKSSEIIFNLGLTKLALKKPKEAFDCMLIALRIFPNNPIIWLRTAESCIMQHTFLNQEQTEIKLRIYKNQEYVLKPKSKILYDSETATSRAIPSPTIEFASYCLVNCINILNDNVNLFSDCAEDSNWKSVSNNNISLSLECKQKMLVAALANSSYVFLEMGNFIAAMKYAQDLMKQPNLPNYYL